MKRKRYPKEALEAGLKKEDIDLIRAMEDYSKPEINEMSLQTGLLTDESIINEILKGVDR